MALQKTFTLPSGVSGNYVRLTAHRWDRQTREAVAWFALYVDATAASAGKASLTPWIAKLVLTGPKFDAYLAPSALHASDVLAQFYVAAKAEPLSCDFGSGAFADAQDV
jgi:hypothetical protein